MPTRELRPRPEARAPSPVDLSDENEDDEPVPVPRKAARKSGKRPRKAPTAAAPPDTEAAMESSDDEDEPTSKRQLVAGRAWQPAEDALLLEAMEKYGPQWQRIATQLQHLGTMRTTAMCRNRYQRIKAPLQEGKEGRNRCKRCGQIKRGHTCTADDVEMPPLPSNVGKEAPAPAPAAPRRRTARKAVPKSFFTLDASFARGARYRADQQRVDSDETEVLPETPVCPPPSGNDFNVQDVEAFLASVNQRSADPVAPSAADGGAHDAASCVDLPPGWPAPSMIILHCASVGSSAPAAEGAPPAASGGYLASNAPPPVASATRRPSRSRRNLSGGIADMSDVDLRDLVDVDLADLHHAAASALASKSFVSFRSYGGASDHPPEPPPPVRQTTPTTLCEEGSAGTPPGALDAPRAATDEAPALSPPPDLVGRAMRLPSSGGALDFEAELEDASLFPTLLRRGEGRRPISPVKHIPDPLPADDMPLCTASAPVDGGRQPPLIMSLPSWSRAPSFSFAERPLEPPHPPQRGLRRRAAVA